MRPVPALLALALALPVSAATLSKSITLQRVDGKQRAAAADAIASAWSGTTLKVVVSDQRSQGDASVVGAQQAKGALLYEWKAAQPVPEGLRAMTEQTLRSWNVAVSADAAAQLELTIRALRIDEVPETFGSSYRAMLEIQGGVVNPQGVGTMPGRRFIGEGKRSGPDRRAKLCNEALTVALEDALSQMLGHPVEEPKPAVLAADASDPSAVPPKAMLKELLRLKDAGVGEPVLLGYVRQRRLAAPLTADDIIKWKSSGLPESVIQAAQEVK